MKFLWVKRGNCRITIPEAADMEAMGIIGPAAVTVTKRLRIVILKRFSGHDFFLVRTLLFEKIWQRRHGALL
jgi:hypothetical protein